MHVILRGAYDFLKARGHWPTTAELALMLMTTKRVVQWFRVENVGEGKMEKHGDFRAGSRDLEWRLTVKGFEALGVDVLAPTRRRPPTEFRAKIADRAVREVLKAMKAGEA